MIKSTLRLFNAVQYQVAVETQPKNILERTIRHGYILDPRIKVTDNLLDTIEEIIGISGEKANASFHKSWSVVQNTPIEVLVIQQIFHYITTYGFEDLGVYSAETVYIPHEALNLPEMNDNIPLLVIKALTAEEILAAIMVLGGSGIALKAKTLDDIMTIVAHNHYSPDFVTSIQNRELSARLCTYYEIVPTKPLAWLRYVVAGLTNESLLIKNEHLCDKLATSDATVLDTLLQRAPTNLAEIFYRYKPLFLAMKKASTNKTFFNRLRREAYYVHRPLPPDYLNTVTAQLKSGTLNLPTLEHELANTTIWRKIRLAYALQYRLNPTKSIMYQIRNGRGWAEEFAWPPSLINPTMAALNVTLEAIATNLAVEGQTVYIPDYIHYTLPATEKQFVGNFPIGTWVEVATDMIFGIHWTNTGKRVDLDLSVIGTEGKIGWDSAYRSENRDVLFSGDMTDAPTPHGATELFYMKRGTPQSCLVLVNYYNFNKGDEVETKVLIAHEALTKMPKGYVVNANKIIASANVTITKKQNVVGIVTNNKFYFAATAVGNAITSRHHEYITHTRQFLVSKLTNSITLPRLLRMAGATIVSKKPNSTYIDLSPEALTTSTIIDLVSKGTKPTKAILIPRTARSKNASQKRTEGRR